MIMIRISNWTLIFTIAIYSSLVATSAATSAEPAAEPTAALSGTVVTAEGKPAPNAQVQPLSWDGIPPKITTNAQGKFSVEIPENRIHATALVVTGENETLGYSGAKYDKAKASEPREIQLTLPRVLEIAVQDQQGAPAAGVTVVARATFATIAQAKTDAQGKATLKVPAEAPLQFIMAWNKIGLDYALFRRADQPKSDPYRLAHDHAEPITLSLHPTRKVQVHVIDAHGKPLAAAVVYPWLYQLPKHGGSRDKANLGDLFRTETDEQGIATINTIPTKNQRRITLWVRKDGYVAHERTYYDPKKPDEKLVAKLLPLVPVSGRVENADGSPAANVEVGAAGDGYTFDPCRETTTTDDTGHFEFQVHPNQYYYFCASDSAGEEQTVSQIVNQTVFDEPPEEIQLTLKPAVRVFGQVTQGEEKTPLAGHYVSLYRHLGRDYYELPKEELLPNPKTGKQEIATGIKAISTRIVQGLQTDNEGRYEFFTGPGEHYLIGTQNQDVPKFSIAEDAEATEETQLDFHIDQPRDAKITGQVFASTNLQQGVPEVRIFGYPTSRISGGHLDAVTDTQGKFEARHPGSDQIVGVFSKDKKQAAIYNIKATENEVSFILQPTASLQGRLIDPNTQQPQTDRDLTAYIRIGTKEGPWMHGFSRNATTDNEGNFLIEGLVPGYEYHLTAITQRNEQGHAEGWRGIDSLKPIKAHLYDLGDVSVKAAIAPRPR